MPRPGREDLDGDRPRRKKSNTGLIVGLAVGGGVLLLVLGACGVGVLYWTSGRAGGSGLPQTSNTRYGGRDVDSWGRQLLDADRMSSQNAAVALAEMGDEALRWFVRGMESNIGHVREYSLLWLPKSGVKKYPGAFEKPLIRMTETDTQMLPTIAQKLSATNSAEGRAAVEKKLGAITEDKYRKDVEKALANWGN